MVRRFPVIWHDFAVSLVPEQYIVSIEVDEKNPFCIVDLNCVAVPHVQNVQKSDLENDACYHLIKLWVVNCKHFFRKTDCSRDIRKMGKRTIGSACEKMSDRQILDEVLCRLENNAAPETAEYIINCRKVWIKDAVR